MLTYQTILYKAEFLGSELGWQLNKDDVIWSSQKYNTAAPAIQEFDFSEPPHNNWFVTMVEREGDEVKDEEIFDSSVIEGYDGSPL